jgi:uncharacterized NAD(P)/FAD-binding protein YdhS
LLPVRNLIAWARLSIAMPPLHRRRVIIIGGGASGALAACHLLRDPATNLHVTLIEKRPDIGHGIAYGTANPNHILNVRASNMSAFADEPNHFWRWLSDNSTRQCIPCPEPFGFVARSLYGRYLASLVEPLRAKRGRGQLDIVVGECVHIADSSCGVSISLADGAQLTSDVVVLATGHEAPAADCSSCYAHPWMAPSDSGISKNAPVLILGTGLTMVDYVLSLVHAGHTGTIFAISRRGLLPQVHRRVEPIRIEAAAVPFGADATIALRWLRVLVDQIEAGGGDWQSVVDGIRPFTQTLWQKLPPAGKRRFLEHARVWWDVHRHRMAPEVDAQIKSVIADGQLTIVAGKACTVAREGSQTRIEYRRRGTNATETLRVAKIVKCTGIVTNPLETANKALRSLFDQRLARADPLHIGIDVAQSCAIVDQSGRPSERLFAVGPVTRAAFWEIVAIPDIRIQCAQLAERILRQLNATDRPLPMGRHDWRPSCP